MPLNCILHQSFSLFELALLPPLLSNITEEVKNFRSEYPLNLTQLNPVPFFTLDINILVAIFCSSLSDDPISGLYVLLLVLIAPLYRNILVGIIIKLSSFFALEAVLSNIITALLQVIIVLVSSCKSG